MVRSFFNLPQEIQLMIWDLCKDSVAPIRHYFSIDDQGRRYAAINAENKAVVNNVVEKKDNGRKTLPGECIIRFTNYVHVETPKLYKGKPIQKQAKRVLDGEPFSQSRRLSPAFVYANLDSDYFCFDYPSDNIYGKDWFRFVRNPITDREKAKLLEDHWIFSVRKLVLYIPEKDIQVSEWDQKVLAGMKLLESVYLVVPNRGPTGALCSIKNERVGIYSILWFPPFMERHGMFIFEQQRSYHSRVRLRGHADSTKANLGKVFAQIGIAPCVKVAIDRK
ncbi:hypothetical protein F4821DRAFT_265877 [Hypoxylon rubiginosum]|uniref:Uncharacterized protein n=1 Tax=Hypoxylon rubiginosum TaxID=110542 RepID=A0ACC0CJ79_9PEZI|nr:hypothetical protein F4821DRAFT_265877 [Hypoxylon rubiginosum]